MASPVVLALRFRDTTPGVDTIQSHREIISGGGAVWWGWWKKDFEADHLDFFKETANERELHVFILDRSTKRMFRAVSIENRMGPDAKPDLGMVPTYYRDSWERVYGWFLLTEIHEIDYMPEVGGQFGDDTLILLSNQHASSVPKVGNESDRSNRSSVLHLTDLHFGPSYGFILQNVIPAVGDNRGTLTDCLLEDLTRRKLVEDIAAILVTGDFTSNGDWSDDLLTHILTELEALRKALGVEALNLIVLPGNHDIERYPIGHDVDVAAISVDNQTTYKHEKHFRTFLDLLTGRSWKAPLDYIQRIKLSETDVLVAVLNSCRILATRWTEYGYVGPNGLDIIKALGKEAVEQPTFKMIALHHHLLPVSDVETPNEKGVTLSLDAAQLLDAAQQAGVHLAVHGHQHVPRLSRYQSIPLMGAKEASPLVIVSNGSTGAAADRRPAGERNTYCVFSFKKDDVFLQMRELRPDKREGAELYSGPLGSRAALPNG